MNLSHGRLAPVPGSSGLVVRVPGAVLFVAGRTPADQVHALTATVSAHTDATPARSLARELASIVAGDDEGTLPGFALVAASTGGTYVKVYGGVEVHLSGDAGAETLTGVGSFTGVDREIAGAFTTISVQPAGQTAADPDMDLDVHGGTTAGDGFVLLAADAAAAPVAEAPAAEAPAAEAPAADEAIPPSPATADLPPTQLLTDLPDDEDEAPAASSEAADVAAMNVVATPSSPPPVTGEEDSVSPPPEAESTPATASAATEAAAAEAAAGPIDAPTQAWTPSTVDFDADDVTTGAAAVGAAAASPAWGSAEPDPVAPPVAEPPPGAPPSLDKGAEDEPLLAVPPAEAPSDQPSWYVPPVSEAPGTPTPPPAGAPPAATAPPTAEGQPTAWEDLPVAEATPAAPRPTEAATVAIPPAPAPAPEPPAAEPPPEAPPALDVPPSVFTSQLLGALDAEEVEAREALPVELDPSEVRQADHPMTEEVMVQGVICSRGHFNDPRSRFCSSCGISMVQNTQILTQGPRPPLGVMVFEDGATFSLSSDYVVGRQPDVHDLVQQGLALPLPVDDPERSISRAHAELRLVDWDVHLVNLSGTNGSFVWDENGQTWIPIPEGQSVVLTPGMRVALGRRSAVFESSLVR